METVPGRRDELRQALQHLATALRPVPGFEAARLLQDADHADRFIFMEFWASLQEYNQGAAQIPKAVFAQVLAPLAGKPVARLLNNIDLPR